MSGNGEISGQRDSMDSPSPVLALWFWTFLLSLHSSLVHSEQSAYSRGWVTGMVCPPPFGSRG